MVKYRISDSKGKAEKAHRGGGIELGSGDEQDTEEDRKAGLTKGSTDRGRYKSGSLPLTEPELGGGGVEKQGRPLAGAGLGPLGKPSSITGVWKGFGVRGVTCSELPWFHRAVSAGA